MKCPQCGSMARYDGPKSCADCRITPETWDALTGEERPTVVVFRRWKKAPMTLIALFPTVPATNDGRYCMSYEHVGQHGAADYKGLLRQTTRVTGLEAQRDGLYQELVKIGYNLDVRMLFSNHWKGGK